MRYYELLYIVNPNLEDDKAKGIIDEIGGEIGKYKVSIINHHLWGKKRLAYPIKNNKYGIYILLQFGAEQFDFLKDFERFLVLNKSVIRHQVVRLDEEPAKVENLEPIVD
ncbi:30S ribosomal protein S6, partial [bacterium]|nr:30S ribosomal protein S6 [bacterium]